MMRACLLGGFLVAGMAITHAQTGPTPAAATSIAALDHEMD